MNETTSILVLVFGTLLFTLFAVFTILYIALQKKKQFRYLIEKQEREHAYAQQLMHSRMEVQEQTQKTISGELHDNIAQMLGLAKMQVHVLADSGSSQSQKMAIETAAMLGNVINEVRTMSHVLNGNFMLKSGLKDAIEKDLAHIMAAKGIQCSLEVTGNTRGLGEDKELILFRVIQESVANSVKHANPTEVIVSLTYEPSILRVGIKDNGKGFDTTIISGGMGLDNIRERVNLLQGEIKLHSGIGEGTDINLSIPIQNEQA